MVGKTQPIRYLDYNNHFTQTSAIPNGPGGNHGSLNLAKLVRAGDMCKDALDGKNSNFYAKAANGLPYLLNTIYEMFGITYIPGAFPSTLPQAKEKAHEIELEAITGEGINISMEEYNEILTTTKPYCYYYLDCGKAALASDLRTTIAYYLDPHSIETYALTDSEIKLDYNDLNNMGFNGTNDSQKINKSIIAGFTKGNMVANTTNDNKTGFNNYIIMGVNLMANSIIENALNSKNSYKNNFLNNNDPSIAANKDNAKLLLVCKEMGDTCQAIQCSILDRDVAGTKHYILTCDYGVMFSCLQLQTPFLGRAGGLHYHYPGSQKVDMEKGIMIVYNEYQASISNWTMLTVELDRIIQELINLVSGRNDTQLPINTLLYGYELGTKATGVYNYTARNLLTGLRSLRCCLNGLKLMYIHIFQYGIIQCAGLPKKAILDTTTFTPLHSELVRKINLTKQAFKILRCIPTIIKNNTIHTDLKSVFSNYPQKSLIFKKSFLDQIIINFTSPADATLALPATPLPIFLDSHVLEPSKASVPAVGKIKAIPATSATTWNTIKNIMSELNGTSKTNEFLPGLRDAHMCSEYISEKTKNKKDIDSYNKKNIELQTNIVSANMTGDILSEEKYQNIYDTNQAIITQLEYINSKLDVDIALCDKVEGDIGYDKNYTTPNWFSVLVYANISGLANNDNLFGYKGDLKNPLMFLPVKGRSGNSAPFDNFNIFEIDGIMTPGLSYFSPLVPPSASDYGSPAGKVVQFGGMNAEYHIKESWHLIIDEEDFMNKKGIPNDIDELKTKYSDIPLLKYKIEVMEIIFNHLSDLQQFQDKELESKKINLILSSLNEIRSYNEEDFHSIYLSDVIYDLMKNLINYGYLKNRISLIDELKVILKKSVIPITRSYILNDLEKEIDEKKTIYGEIMKRYKGNKTEYIYEKVYETLLDKLIDEICTSINELIGPSSKRGRDNNVVNNDNNNDNNGTNRKRGRQRGGSNKKIRKIRKTNKIKIIKKVRKTIKNVRKTIKK